MQLQQMATSINPTRVSEVVDVVVHFADSLEKKRMKNSCVLVWMCASSLAGKEKSIKNLPETLQASQTIARASKAKARS